ncbi:MAG: class I SAM-dependent methyltransferase [Saprospiraceae bacterium]|nr:class I SAM-dependent methyltransferase [Saprospiraceae bacterium]HMW39474.1 class I SAM-dependent methyltransferase [Saprospiraceae bacterium]HMX88088.1 class I SAM-dependent methyltransferase [Saprospiraceae bacterium]HMZ38945.1 class I SAM-dependent methyltransferase [Saprospiraceae bacterium]HNB30989.1 class I SAM-dependent methyltransferase [Saprospiraceae bacterium]
MESFYGKHLSYIHDKYHGDIAQNAAQEILKNPSSRSYKKVIDLGCGSGILASILSQNGFKVIGVDISYDILEIAKRKSPNSTFIQKSLFEYSFEFSDIICAIGEPFNYMFDEKADNSELAKLIHKIYDNLNPHGLFLFDVLSDDVDADRNIKIIENDDYTMFLDIEVNAEKSVLTRKMTYFVRNKNCYEKDTETHQQILFNLSKVEEILAETGFKYEKLNGYNRHFFRKGHYGYLCRK